MDTKLRVVYQNIQFFVNFFKNRTGKPCWWHKNRATAHEFGLVCHNFTPFGSLQFDERVFFIPGKIKTHLCKLHKNGAPLRIFTKMWDSWKNHTGYPHSGVDYPAIGWPLGSLDCRCGFYWKCKIFIITDMELYIVVNHSGLGIAGMAGKLLYSIYLPQW